MRIAVWNCNMAYHRKHVAAARLDADILIVSECADVAVLEAKGVPCAADSTVWAGSYRHKGLAVFARAPYRIESLRRPRERIPIWVLPARITTPKHVSLDLLAVWSFWYRDKRNTRGNPIIDALETYANRFVGRNLIVAGDFNNNVIWDSGRTSDHGATSHALGERGLVSAYHMMRRVAPGEEPEPTLFWRDRTEDGPSYHIDYIYVPKKCVDKRTTVEVGSHRDWVAPGLSDHVPMVVDLPSIE